ncbi:polyamine aminopropyltransferase [Chloroflexota bacterium]
MHEQSFSEKDPFSPINYTYKVSKVLYSGKSKFQDMLVFESPDFGRVLALDGVVQLTERDEFFYHEMLAQVAMHAHADPRKVLIIGGGDGGTLREVLKHKSVEKAQLIELDMQVVEISKTYLPGLASAFSDPRANVAEMDGSKFVKETGEKFDIVIVDSTDPVDAAKVLFSDEFFADVHSMLNKDGMLVMQTESLHFHRRFVIDVQQRLGKIFKTVKLYTVPLSTYAGNWWTFSIASKKHDPASPVRQHEVETKYYDQQVHENAFLPASLYDKLLGGELDW